MIAYGASHKQTEKRQLKLWLTVSHTTGKLRILVIPKWYNNYGQNDYGVKS
jgi:hypothetical protein